MSQQLYFAVMESEVSGYGSLVVFRQLIGFTSGGVSLFIFVSLLRLGFVRTSGHAACIKLPVICGPSSTCDRILQKAVTAYFTS